MAELDSVNGSRSKAAAKLRVFIVEDDPMQRELISRFLTMEGFVVETYGSPIGATNAARKFNPDIVIVDLDLPAYNGQHIIPLMRNRGISARFFIRSAADESDISSACNAVQADGWFTKSGSIEDFVSKIKKEKAGK
jgi:two-component system OmpR family response regulator